ncbi:MAG: hypothetical protein ACYC33_00375 [Thermoleophilia bacterium]
MTGCVVRDTESLVVAVAAYQGPPLGVGEAFDRVLSWADVHHVEQWGPLIGVYVDSRSGVETIEAEAWLPLPPANLGEDLGDADIVVRAEEPDTVASCIHRGYPDEVGASLACLFEWIGAQGLHRTTATHRQVYRNAPKGSPAEWEVELQVPVAAVGPED